jgi:hypothetical protein
MVKRTNTPTHLNKTLEQKCSGVLFYAERLSRFHRAWNLRPPVSASVRRKILTPIYRKFREICKIGNNYDTFVVV